MASRKKQQDILAIVGSDSTFATQQTRGVEVWVGKCIHCDARLVVESDGRTLATIEHIVPRNHGGTDELGNLALACRRCNTAKGVRHDCRHASDPGLRAMIGFLQERRRARWRCGR